MTGLKILKSVADYSREFNPQISSFGSGAGT